MRLGAPVISLCYYSELNDLESSSCADSEAFLLEPFKKPHDALGIWIGVV